MIMHPIHCGSNILLSMHQAESIITMHSAACMHQLKWLKTPHHVCIKMALYALQHSIKLTVNTMHAAACP